MGAVHLEWADNPPGELVEHYNVFQAFNGTAFVKVAESQTSEIDILDLAPGHYDWKVTAVNLAGEGPASPVAVGPNLPSAPSQPTVTVIG